MFKTKTLAILLYAFGLNIIITAITEGWNYVGISHLLSGLIVICIAAYIHFATKNIMFIYKEE